MKRTLEIALTDEDVRKAIKMYVENQMSESQTVNLEDIRFSVTQGYNGEMGGKPSPNIVEAIIETVV